MTAEKEITIWAKTILAIMEDKDAKAEQCSANLALILNRKKKGYLLPKIIKKAVHLYDKKHGIEIFLAKDHPADVIEKIKKKASDSFGKEIKGAKVSVDENLIGGFRIKAGNFLVRASIKDFLNEAKSKLTG
jgi:F0F1-type ATP synthase delta subunit